MFHKANLHTEVSLFQKIQGFSWGLLFLIVALACVGFTALYSAAGGDMDPWASRQFTRFIVGIIALFIVALIPVKLWYRLAYPIYILGFVIKQNRTVKDIWGFVVKQNRTVNDILGCVIKQNRIFRDLY